MCETERERDKPNVTTGINERAEEQFDPRSGRVHEQNICFTCGGQMSCMKTTVERSALTCSGFLQTEGDLRTHMELCCSRPSCCFWFHSLRINKILRLLKMLVSFCFSIKKVSEGPAVLNVLKVSLLWDLELVSAAGAL